MIPLILPTCLKVSTLTTASASIGPDVYALVSTVNIPHLHASPSLPTPCICVCVPSVSLASAFLPFFYYSLLHPGKSQVPIIIFCWMSVACLTRCALLWFPNGLEADRRYRVSGSMRRNRRCTFVWLRSEICSLAPWALHEVGPSWLMSPVWSKMKTSPACFMVVYCGW